MKILIIGGTGTISSAITRQLSEGGYDLWLLNRGTRKSEVPANVRQVICDINDEASVLDNLAGEMFDAVCEFIGFTPAQVERDLRLFQGRTRQYVYISSGPKGCWQVLKRMLDGKPVIIQGDGTSLWTLTWNEDFARGFIGLLGNPKAIGEAFQIMSDESLTWTQIYQCVANALNVPFKPYYVSSEFLSEVAPKEWDFRGNLLGDKSLTVIFDCAKLKRVVPGFQATTRFHEGVRRSVEYLLSHPELQIEEPDFDAWCDRVIEVQETAKKQF